MRAVWPAFPGFIVGAPGRSSVGSLPPLRGFASDTRMSTAVVLAPSILVVDARAVSRTHAGCLIRNRWPDARVNEANDADSALAELADGETDLVIVDLPGETGLAFAQRLRDKQPKCQVALLADAPTAAQRSRADKAGIRLFRTPVTGDVIEQVLALVGYDD
jgi:DNA-binding NarL/FixJ family response regulator